MNYLVIGLLACSCVIWGYNAGQMNTLLQDDRTVISKDYKEIDCNDVVRGTDGQLVCEINMDYEDDNLKLYKGVYGNE